MKWGPLEKASPFSYHIYMNLNVIQPYSDNTLAWNDDLKRYELTIQFFKANFQNNFNDDQVLLNRLRKNSRKIYNFIRYRGFSLNWKITEFLINHTQEGREFILAALTEQMEADNESGYNDLSSMPAISSQGQTIDRDQLYANQISPDAEQIIENSGSYFGISIVNRTVYPFYYANLWRTNQ